MMQTRGPAGAKAAAPCCLQSCISPKAATRSRPHLAATTRDIPGPAGARSPGVPELRPLPALWNPDLCPGEQEVCSSGRSVAEVQSVAPRWLPGGHCHEEDDNKIEKRYISWWKSWKSEGSPAASSPCCSVPRAPSAQRSLAVVEAVMLNLTTGWLYAISATRISFQIINQFLNMEGQTHSLRTLLCLKKQIPSTWILTSAGVPGFPLKARVWCV